MDFNETVTEPVSHLAYPFSLPSIATAVLTCFLCFFYLSSFGRRLGTNATWYALTEDALANHSKAREQWMTNAQELLYGGLKKVTKIEMRVNVLC
jgi:hypothetical protein